MLIDRSERTRLQHPLREEGRPAALLAAEGQVNEMKLRMKMTNYELRMAVGLCLLCTVAYPLLASTVSVTNHAGRVVSGEFGGVTNGTFVVGGRAYPLSILPKGEVFRVKKLAGCDVRTAKEKRLDHARELKLERIRLREAEGEIDRETAERLRCEARGSVK